MHWYQYTKNQIETELGTNMETGLSAKEAESRFLKYGPNLLPESPPDSWFKIFANQFKSPLIYILLLCSTIVYFIGEHTDSVIILAVLIFNAVVGAIQEGRSQSTLRSLKKLSESEAAVIRGGEEEIIPEKDAVVGDILVLQEGQKVVADARLLHVSNLSCDEAALTGESGGVHKSESSIGESSLPPAGQKNMVFKGTNILTGNGLGAVVATGAETEIGKTAKNLLEVGETEIPLQRNIKKLSRLIIYAIGVISAGLFSLGLAYGRSAREMFGIVVSLAVSMIPEGLPLVLTLILVTGVYRMSRRKALVKKLQAVEALGQARVIAVDKTGTITKNEMAVKKILSGGKIYTLTGSGYSPDGHLELGGQKQPGSGDVGLSARIASLASRATVRYLKQEGVYKVAGDPTEAAMQVLGEKLGEPREKLFEEYKETAEIAFSYNTKFRAVFYEHRQEIFCAISGAPEVLMNKAASFLENGERHPFTAQVRKQWEAVMEEFSSQALRVVACGFKLLGRHHKTDNIDDLVLTGLLAIEDAVRPEAKQAIKLAKEAGVKIVMITGDHKVTAKAIAEEAGIYQAGDEAISGSELAELSKEQLAARLNKISVYSRVTPQDKMKIIEAYKHLGVVVAMTGDGVNDAPSLAAADLGVAMGKIGTEVAKDAADIVLLDDNLSSIVAAIAEGRHMYKNIQKSLLFLFSTSLGELFAITAALFLHMPMPVLAAQILWLNLVTDPLIGTALALEKKEAGLLHSNFQKQPKYFMTPSMLLQMPILGAAMAGAALYLFNLYYSVDYFKGITIALTTLAVAQWYNGFNCQSDRESIFSGRFFKNPYLILAVLANLGLQLLAIYHPFFQKILKTVPLTWGEWAAILGVAFVVILAEEIRKLIYNFKLYLSKIRE